MEYLVIIVLVVLVVLVVRATGRRREQQRVGQRQTSELAAVRTVTDEDVTRFGEELRRLDSDLLTETLDEPTRQDYQRALDSYESAKQSLDRVTRADEVRHVTEALEDGRYAVACVRARVAGTPLPQRRPPCFFNPAHGPSTSDVDWAPAGGQVRRIPVCAADADRLSQGAEPDVRTVPQGVGRVPYWQAGPAYSPWASGYFGGYLTSGLLPTVLMMGMLSPGWMGGDPMGWDGDGGDGYDGNGDGGDGYDGDGYDGNGDGGSDGYDGGDGGYDTSGGDFGGGDWGGGDFGGGDFGGDF
jgi:hypothetical protein